MQKGVSPILASVFLILVGISLAGAFLIYTQRATAQLVETGTLHQQQFQQQTDVQFSIEAVSNNKVFLKNWGDINITNASLSIFLDGVMLNYTLPTTIEPGQLGILHLNQTWRTSFGERTLRVSGRARSDSVRVRVQRPEHAVLYLNFDEGGGTTTKDQSGWGNDGTILDGDAANGDGDTPPQWVDGFAGKALQFDGTDDQIRVANAASLNMSVGNNATYSITIKVGSWVRGWGTAPDNWTAPLYHGDWGPQNGHLIFTELGPSSGYMAKSNISGTTRQSGVPKIGREQYHLFSWTYDGSKWKVYLDGNLVETQNVVGTLNSPAFGPLPSRLSIGAAATNHRVFSGIIDDVLIFNRSYSPDEIYIINRA